MTPTLKHGGGKHDGLVFFAGSTVCNLHRVTGTLNQKSYHSILQHNAIPSGLRLVGSYSKDNDPKHTSRLCNNYLRRKEPNGRLQIIPWEVKVSRLNFHRAGLG